jgi:RNA polymerase sigma factor (sigma-70 family)
VVTIAISPEELVEDHYPYILNSARILTHFDEDLAQDITQETFYRALRALPGLAEREQGQEIKYRAWLYRILSNIWIDVGRHQSIMREHSVVLSEEIWECIPDRNAGEQEQREEEEFLGQVLALLPASQREILLLRAQGVSFRKLRARYHVHISTAKRRAAEAEQRFVEAAQELLGA